MDLQMEKENTSGCRSGSGIATRIGCLWAVVDVRMYGSMYGKQKMELHREKGICERTTTAASMGSRRKVCESERDGVLRGRVR